MLSDSREGFVDASPDAVFATILRIGGEHVHRDRYFAFLDDLHRVCKPGALIQIWVPHASGMWALKHPTHYNFFGIGSFSTFQPEATATAMESPFTL